MPLILADEQKEVAIAYLYRQKTPPPALSNLDPFVADKGIQGARMAITDNNSTGRFVGQNFVLQEYMIPSDGNLLATYAEIQQKGYAFILTDLNADELRQLYALAQENRPLLFDISTRDDFLRSKACLPDLLHMQPSRAMRADALAQYMLKKKWRKWFLVTGNDSGDHLFAESIKRSAKRFGLKLVAEKQWQHDFDSRRTAQNDVPVFTQGVDYDVLVVADERGVFGEYLQYRTWKPRPVIGTQGMQATSWHRTHEQWGAVQMQNRFKKQTGRWMLEEDYGAYLAVRAIGEAATRTASVDRIKIQNYLFSNQFALQGYKGRPLSFRKWNGQLRQPVLLAAARSLVATAPVQGFLHPVSELDTLGYDKPETQCAEAAQKN